MSSIGPVVSEEKMFEDVDGRMDDRVTGILIAHPRAFGSGELKTFKQTQLSMKFIMLINVKMPT